MKAEPTEFTEEVETSGAEIIYFIPLDRHPDFNDSEGVEWEAQVLREALEVLNDPEWVAADDITRDLKYERELAFAELQEKRRVADERIRLRLAVLSEIDDLHIPDFGITSSTTMRIGGSKKTILRWRRHRGGNQRFKKTKY